MTNSKFAILLKSELARIDIAHVAKRGESFIEGFVGNQAIINHKKYLIFNSNDYLGLRLNPILKKADHKATQKYGTGPGAVRFISGTLKIHRDLEKALAKFHHREDALVISSAFAANMAVITSLVRGSGQETLINSPVLIISDELNHRSIVDGIRLSSVPSDNKVIYHHLDYNHLDEILINNSGKFSRAIVITDGVFSMLGQITDLDTIRTIIDKHQAKYSEGILLVVDDCHGVGTTPNVTTGADILVGTLGKALGADGGYVVGDKIFIDYLRETAATYIYSNSISPGTTGAALAAVKLISSKNGLALIKKSQTNVKLFKTLMTKAGFKFAAESNHPIQPVLIGDTEKTQLISKKLFEKGILVTPISYPVVPKGRDEIRVQISATHTKSDIIYFVKTISKYAAN
jgi:glycine C-acetyltransferase